MKKTLSLILVCACLFAVSFSVVSCAEKPAKEEITAICKELYEKSLVINEYIYGKGLPYEKKESDAEIPDTPIKDPIYVDITKDSPYKTEEQLKKAVLEVYSEDYYKDAIEKYLFKGYGDKEKVYARYKVVNDTLQVDKTNKGSELKGRFKTDNIKVDKLSSNYAVLKMEYINGKGENLGFLPLTMTKTPDGWRFDAPTY